MRALRRVAANRRFYLVLSLLFATVVFPLTAFHRDEGEQSKALSLFRQQYRGGHYGWSSALTLNSKEYILATWHPGGHATELHLDVFECTDHESAAKFRKLYSDNVSEELIGAYAAALDGSGKQNLVLLSNSAQIKIVKILSFSEAGEPRLIFDNGGTDVTVLKDEKEIWLKSRSAGVVDVYRWTEEQTRFVKAKTLNILF
jgi:hypothetical protein